MPRRNLARWEPEARDQSLPLFLEKALLAALTAKSTSSAVPAGTSPEKQKEKAKDNATIHKNEHSGKKCPPMTPSVAGLMTGILLPRTGSFHSPSMKSCRRGTTLASDDITGKGIIWKGDRRNGISDQRSQRDRNAQREREREMD
ncbi:unnamed protein product [Spirodela intermedia]|uniref:Uncharacterized protein n=1 Tax=Spirodela intermedia TaxID=51605 RepID=A0A7I8LCF3_SPIIN|nr:unnamed protein product [Spirodela intermedia]